MKTVAIVGGGITGLSTAEAITRAAGDVRAIVLEAADRPGGKITTQTEDGFVVEAGPHGFLDKEPAAMALVERVGLGSALVKANEASARRYIVRAGQLRLLPMSPPAFLFSSVLPFAARMRVLKEPWAAGPPDGVEETVWDFAARRLGPTAADVMVDAFVTGIYGGDPKRLSLTAAFPRLAELEREYGSLIRAQIAIAKLRKAEGKAAGAGGPAGTLHSFRAGLGTLADALADRVDVRCGFRAERLVRADGGGFTVEGTGDSIDADAVVVTVPAYETARLLGPMASEEVQPLLQIPYVPIAVVVQGFSADEVGHALDGFGFLVPDGEAREILGSIWASTVFAGHAPDGRVMLRTLLGGARRPEMAEGDDETLSERARRELVALMGISDRARPVFEKIVRWPRAIPQYEVGHAARVEAAAKIAAAVPGIFVGGNAFCGVAMIQCIAAAGGIADSVVRWLGQG